MLVLIQHPFSAYASKLPHEFTASYALEMLGTVLAKATYSLKHTDNGVTMKQSTRPAGLVALLRDDKIDVRSDMVVENGRLLLVNYDYRHSGNDKDRNVRFKINWQNHEQDLVGTATGTYEGKNVNLKIHQPVWDPLSIQVPIMTDAAEKLPPIKYSMFVQGEFKHYLFETHGTETVSFNGRQFKALKITGTEARKDRAMYVWVVPELHNIPVKIEQWKNGKLKSTVVLENVSFGTDDANPAN